MFYTLFNPVEQLRVPISIDPRARQLRFMFYKDLNNVANYYRSRPQFINNTHILIKLINLLDKGEDEDMNSCYMRVSKTYRNVCSSLGITTYATIGRMHEGEFYQNTQEYILANEKYFPVSSIQKDWKDLQPVKTLCHEVKKLSFIQPGPLCYCDGAGYSVVEINPVMLLCMYKAYCLDVSAKNKFGYATTPKEFITRFVFPNMMISHMEQVLANRVADLGNNSVLQAALDINRKKLKQPFYIYSKHEQIDASFKYQLKNLRTKTTSAQQTLSNIGTYVEGNLFELFKYQSSHRSVQLDWIYGLVFLKYFDVLKSVSYNDSLVKRSKGHLYQMSKELVRNQAANMAIKMASKNKQALYGYVIEKRLIDFTALSGSVALRSTLVVNRILSN